MKFSIFIPTGFVHELSGFANARAAYDRLVEIAKAADRTGYEAVLAPDHLTPLPSAQEIVFEAWSLITALAERTERVRLGLLVGSAGYRNPALAAKMASTVDVISNGRLIFGLGAGWHEPDYEQYGFEFGTLKDRSRRLEEAAQIVLGLWTQDEFTFDGQFYRTKKAINHPKGVQTPHIPLMIAGSGEKVTLRRVARYADSSNFVEPPDVARAKYEVLKGHAEDVGRDYDSIHRTVLTLVNLADSDAAAREALPAGAQLLFPGNVADYGLVGTPETVAQRIAAYDEAGVQELVLLFADPTSVEDVLRFAETFVDA